MNAQNGFPAGAISRMLNRLEDDGLCMHGFLLTRHGQTIAEGYWAPFQSGVPHRMFSVSKSMTSLAVGLLMSDGKLRLSDAICDYFPDKLPDTVPDPLRRLTIRDMLRMATCHSQTTYKQANDPDWTRSFFTFPPTHEPGTVFNYDTSSSHTLAALVERLTGTALIDFLQERLWNSIGAVDEKRWLADPMGVSQGGTGLLMTLHDLSKTAQFCLHCGKGTVLEPYLRQATQEQIETPLQNCAEQRYGYGYQFWRTRNNGFAMYGMGGQLALCLPELETTFCTIADTQLELNDRQAIFNAFWQEVYPHLSGGQASSVGECDALSEKLRTLRMRPVAHNDAYIGGYGRAFAFAPQAAIQSLCLRSGELVLETTSGRHMLPFGVGEWVTSTFPGTAESCIASGGWIAPGMFRLLCCLIGDRPGCMDMLLSFKDDTLTLHVRAPRESVMEGYAGITSGRLIAR